MTVSNSVYRNEYNGNGSTTNFSYTFRILDEDHISVYVGGVLKTILTHYSVSGVGEDTGGTITFLTAPATGTANVVFVRNVPLTQEVDYVENDPFPAEVHETALDKITMICQSLQEQADRTIGYSASVPIADRLSADDFIAAIETAETAAIAAQTAQGLAETAQGLAEAARDDAQAAVGGVRVSANDTTANNLETKLLAGTGVVLTTENDGGNETRTITTDYSRRNRLCNGDLIVDNVNDGAVITPSTGTSAFACDNFALHFSQTSKITAQRIAASNISGLKYSVLLTVASAVASPGAADYFYTRSGIEGWQDWDDMAWGTAQAKDMTLQMYARVSVPGEYSFAIQNGARNRSYVFTKTLAVGDNYWTQTVPGDTAGTWPIDNQTCVNVIMDLGSGSNYETATIGAWHAGNGIRKSTSVKWISNAAATFEVGGRKVENGSFATPGGRFRDDEAWCQRYHPTFYADSTATERFGLGSAVSTTLCAIGLEHKVPARVKTANIVVSAAGNFQISNLAGGGTTGNCTAIAFGVGGVMSTDITTTTTAGAPTLVAGNPCRLLTTNVATARIRLTGAEL